MSYGWRNGQDAMLQPNPKMAGGPKTVGNELYNRKAFNWDRTAKPPQESQPPQAVQSAAPAAGCLNRIYEIVTPTAVVRAEPHMGAKLKAKKGRGGRLICSEITVNGWLKLANEPGWIISHMQGVDDLGEVAVLIDGSAQGLGGPVDLAVPEYQAQGMCCLEVVFKSGVPVMDAPRKDAKTIVTRKCGEFVFAQTQNFDGWVKLWGEDGWVLATHKEWGQLLKPRMSGGTDLWALSDAWAAARKARNGSLGAKEIKRLKDLEKKIISATSLLWDQHATEDKIKELVETGLLCQDDLEHSEHWAFQRLFTSVLKQAVAEEADLRELLPDFVLGKRVPPLWGAEDELLEEGQWEDEQGWGDGGMTEAQQFEYNPDDPDFEGAAPVEFNGKTYLMFPNNVIFDPPNQIPVGVWNTETNKIEPAAGRVPGCPYAALSYFGTTYLLMPDGKLLEPEKQKVVGSYNHETHEMELENDPQKALANAPAPKQDEPDPDPPLHDPVFDDDEPVDPQEYLERGHQMVKTGRLKSASTFYGLALQGYSKQRTVNMSFECEILRARAACFLQLGSFRELKDDAERILGCCPNDAQAQEWKRKASDGIRRAKFGLDYPSGDADMASAVCQRIGPSSAQDAQKKEACTQCNGLATKCYKCGAGMERCAYCAGKVTRANCCSRCHNVYYCGRECQRAHWKVHKLECKSSEE